jgi:nitric oxide reductase subunit C
MLSKSAARAFFLAGTVVCGGAFIWLTVDSMADVPARSQEHLMDEAVIHGHDIWTDNNCMGCHTLLGEGAYYAPELTKVVDPSRRALAATFLKDPEAMYPGRRKMVKYNFTDEEIDALIAFLAWIEGKVDTNGFPAKPIMRRRPETSASPGPRWPDR